MLMYAGNHTIGLHKYGSQFYVMVYDMYGKADHTYIYFDSKEAKDVADALVRQYKKRREVYAYGTQR